MTPETEEPNKDQKAPEVQVIPLYRDDSRPRNRLVAEVRRISPYSGKPEEPVATLAHDSITGDLTIIVFDCAKPNLSDIFTTKYDQTTKDRGTWYRILATRLLGYLHEPQVTIRLVSKSNQASDLTIGV